MNLKNEDMSTKTLGIFVVFLCFSFYGRAQVESARVMGAYTYNFARYTNWPNEAAFDRFGILVISKDEKIRNEFRSFAESRKIKGKSINLQLITDIPGQISDEIHLIVVSRDQKAHCDVLYSMIANRPILLVSENNSDQSKVMINLFSSAQDELLFEVNKANIYNHHLSIDPEILLMGGTEIDVIALYRSTQNSLDELEKRFDSLNDSLLMLNQTITSSLAQVEEQRLALEMQQLLLKQQEEELLSGKKALIEQNKAIVRQQAVMREQQNELSSQTKQLQVQKSELLQQQSLVIIQQENIQKSSQTLDSLMVEIDQRNIELDEQSNIIDRQKMTTMLAVLSGILAMLILALLIGSYRRKVKKNALLIKQKEEIVEINRKMKLSNQSLYHTLGQLKETQSQLVSSEKMASLGVLTAGIAHEINNPVNFIYTGINSLRNDYNDLIPLLQTLKEANPETDPQVFKANLLQKRDQIDFSDILEIIPQTIDDIRVGAERSAEIIRGLRNFSRIDSDSWQEADIHEGIDSALLLLRNKFKQHIKVEKHYAQLPKIECYPGRLNQVFLNILSNAIDATEVEGTITITTRLLSDQVQIEVADTGRGISKENIGKIFDPFFTTKTVGSGVGLGLSISFGIIKDHNGLIEVKSEENVETVFTISLPCKHNI
jgi:signal transduction histidine kinase